MRSFDMKTLSLVCLLLFGASLHAAAQGTASRVTGTVLDPSGAAVANATVTLTNEGTNVSLTTQTSDAGTYTFDSVQVGTYTVSIEASNFKRFITTGNTVLVNQPATIDVTLEAGGVNEVVQVSSAAELVQTSTSGNLGNTVEERPLEVLPLVGTRGRNPLQFVEFQPGVVVGSNTGGGVHVNGSRDRAINYTLDGIDINETSAGGSNFTPLRTNPDSVTQFQVITGNFTADLGRSSGAQVTLVTRSGTNEFSGNLFEFYQTPRLQANEYENTINRVNLQPIPKRQFVQNIFGGSLGGPVILPRFGEGGRRIYNGRNKTFFFTNLQLLRTSETRLVTRTVYTQTARQGIYRYVFGGLNGNAGAARPSVDASGNPLPGLDIRQYNVVANDPARLGLDPTTRRLIDLTPLPNNFADVGDGLNTAGFTFFAPQIERQYDFTAKVDHNFNDRNTIYVRYAQGEQNSFGDNGNGGLQAFPNTPRIVDTFRTPKNLAVNYRANITDVLTNEFVAGFNRFRFDFTNPDPNAALNAPVILNNVTDPLNSSPTLNNARQIRTIQLVDNVSYIRGAHTIKTGLNFRFQSQVDDRSSVAGSNIRESVTLGRLNTNFTGFNVPAAGTSTTPGINSVDQQRLQNTINDLLGRVGRIDQAFIAASDTQFAPAGTRFTFDARYNEYDFYAQDTWKVLPNLTIDYGLRYEIRLAPRAANGGLILRPDRPVRLGESPSNTLRFVEGKLFDDDYNNFGPSIGFAYDPFKDGKTAIRANYRLAYDRLNTFLLSSVVFQSAPGVALNIANLDVGTAGLRLSQGLPTLAPTNRTPQQERQPLPFSNSSLTVIDPDFRSPKTNQWALSVQREIGFNSVIEVNYIGRRGVGLYGAYDVNQVDIFNNGFLNAYNVVSAGGDSPLINQLLQFDTRRNASETGSQAFRRIFSPEISQGAVATIAANLATRTQNGTPLLQLAGVSPFLFQPYPQFAGALNVVDTNDFSTYHAGQVQYSRRFNRGLAYQLSYTFAKSLDTRSFDPAFTVVGRGSAQSASSTPFDIRNRRLNYARSDFDRRHALQGYFTFDLPFGEGRSFGKDLNPFLDRLIGGFQLSGIVRLFSGRPFTVYSGVNTLSNVVQSPANCSDCTPDLGRITLENNTNFFFTADQRARFSAPAPGTIGNTGRNFFTGPPQFQLDLALGKVVRFDERRNLELRGEAQNVTNTPSFGFPTAVINSATFGRVRDSVVSTSRKIQLVAKFNF